MPEIDHDAAIRHTRQCATYTLDAADIGGDAKMKLEGEWLDYVANLARLGEEGMNRAERRAAQSYIDSQNALYGTRLQAVARDKWPNLATPMPIEVWRSREFLVQIYDERDAVERLSVCRANLSTGGRWEDDISWDDLQRLKAECGRGDKWGVECYPADEHVVNVANMRHLFILPEPPKFGWAKSVALEKKP